MKTTKHSIQTTSIQADSIQATPVQLTYRGIRYTPKQHRYKTRLTTQENCYRGNRYQVKKTVSLPATKNPHTLVYRGIPYIFCPSEI